MEKVALPRDVLKEVFQVTPHLLKLPATKLWIDYDKDADVLYISFERPQKSTDSEMTQDGVLYRYRDNKIVGITVLDASER